MLYPDSRYCVPVDALALAHHDIAFGDGHHVLLGRLLDRQFKIVWQENYFTRDVAPSAAVDVDGDGTEELCLYAGDSTAASAWALGADGRERLRIGLSREAAARAGVTWDGKIAIDGVLEREGRRLLVCRLTAGFAGHPRGVTLIDVATRAREWTYDMGTFPVRAATADVDGDGASEVLVTTGSIDNHVSANGTDDSHDYVIAIGAGGAREWQLEVGGPFGISQAAVLPPDAENTAPRVVATFCSQRARQPEPGRLFLLDGRTGREIDRREFEQGLGVPRPFGAGDGFVVGSRDGMLRVFDHGLRLVCQRSVGEVVEAWGCADVDGDGEPEIVASTQAEVLVLERDLMVRARMPVTEHENPAPVSLASAGVGHARFAVSDGRAILVDPVFQSHLEAPASVAPVLGLALATGLVVPFARRARRRARRPSEPAVREFLLDYHQIRHETFEQERPFARLRLWAQARAAGHPLPAEMLESACAEFEHLGLPTLARFADRAAAIQVERARVRSIRARGREVVAALQKARAAGDAARIARVVEALAAIDALAQDCYEVYWEVVMRAPCRATVVAAEAMLAKAILLERGTIRTRYDADPHAREPVLFDPDELRALIGELVENSARALVGSPDAALEVSVREHPVDPRRVVISVSDNGPGLAPDQHARLFTPEGSTREGGGFGLYHAREVARRWLADLTVADPPSGRGLAVQLVVLACRVVDRRGGAAAGKEPGA